MEGNVTLEAVLWDTITALVSAIDSRNHTTGHSMRVADYAVRIGQALGWDKTELEAIRLGALLHDIGQISWPSTLSSCKRKLPNTSLPIFSKSLDAILSLSPYYARRRKRFARIFSHS